MMSTKWTFSFLTLMLVGLLIAAPAALANKITLRVYDANRGGPGAGADAPADISAEDGIQVLADSSAQENSHVMIRLDSAEPLVTGDVVPTAFVIVGATIEVTGTGDDAVPSVTASEGNKRFVITLADGDDEAAHDKEVTVFLVPGKLTSATTGDKDSSGATLKFKYMRADPSVNEAGVDPAPTLMLPKVVSMTRATAIGSTVASAFLEEKVSGEFLVKIVLTEKPNGGLHSDKLADRIKAVSASNATVTNVAIGAAIDRVPNRTDDSDFSDAVTSLPYQEGGYTEAAAPDAAGGIPNPTGRDDKYYTYLATIVPSGVKTPVVVQINDFKDLVLTQGVGADIVEAGEYEKPSEKAAPANREKLEVTVVAAAKAKAAGYKIAIPNDIIVPAGGYLILGRNDGAGDDTDEKRTDSTQIIYPGDPKATPILVGDREANQLKYNLIKAGLPNLETFLGTGGTIDVMSTGLVVSEIMWGTDASLATPTHNHWIELYNAGAEYKTKDAALIFYAPNDAVPAKTAAVAATATTAAVPVALPTGVSDRVGTITDTGAYWSIAGKGQSGRTGHGETAGELIAVVPTQAVISMYRVMMMDASGNMPMGNTAAAWMQSTPPSVNFNREAIGVRVGSPGASRLVTAAAAAAAAAAADTSVMMPASGQIYISEVMFAGGGTLPQWIEISNGSRTEEVNLSGWTLTIDNAAADADVSVGASIKFTIPEGTKIDPSGQHATPSTLLVVTETGRNNLTGAMAAGQVLNIWETQQTELILGGVTKRRYSLLSGMAFQITLAPPVPIVVPAAATPAPTTAAEIAAKRAADAAKRAADAKTALKRAAATDMAGNLGADGAAAWALPMSEDGRSSIIRRHVQVSIGAAEPEDGTMMLSWALASDTSFAQVTHIRAASYYGAANDVGTPGFRAGGALPVELSHFRPARDKATGAVVITWSTQSELNNAGFFVKRSQQRDGQFKVINAAMIAGAGTTSEKQFYTYTDTTAQPNVVYYYQIEDVSLDGNRQTLTRGMRLKGHVSVAGKATLTWGELKTSQ